MLQRTGEAETITTHYLFALGAYRALYILNWIYRFSAEGHVDLIAWLAGLLQTVLYSDFFYIYYTKSANLPQSSVDGCTDIYQGYTREEVPYTSLGLTKVAEHHAVRCQSVFGFRVHRLPGECFNSLLEKHCWSFE